MNIAIVEDEDRYAEELIGYLHRLSSELELPVDCQRFHDGASLVGDYRHGFDVIFLDIDLPVMNGIETAQAIRAQDSQVLLMFITNLAQYAVKGYEFDAVDYVLKPLNYASISMKFRKILRILRSQSKKAVFIVQDGMRFRIPANRICFVEVQGHMLCYHTTDGMMTETNQRSIRELERELQADGFCRCHSSYLVNFYFVDSLNTDTVTVAGEKLPVSRGRKQAFQQNLMLYTRNQS